ncbi:MAG: long-chain fatty acid--CoA ligase [Pyrinomonadaceae bacterium]
MNENLRPLHAPRSSGGRAEPPLSDEPKTLPELFLRSAARFNLASALNYKKNGEWKKISSEDMIRRSEAIALGLHSLGLKRGDRAAILAANSPEWTLADAGCQFAGVIDVPIYTTLAGNAVRYILDDAEARLLFVQDKETYERISDQLCDSATIETLVFFDISGVSAKNAISLDGLIAAGSDLRLSDPDLAARLRSDIDPDDIATLIYTSGTTGESKGVMLSHANLISNIIDAGSNYEFNRDDVSLSVLPLSHVFERTGMYLYIFNGMSVHYAESIEKVPDNLQEVHPTLFIGVPRIFEKVYSRAKLKAGQSSPRKERVFDWAIDVAIQFALEKEAGHRISPLLSIKHMIADRLVYSKLRQFFGGKLRFCITGGAALSDDIYLIFTGAGISIMQGYGLTETSPVVSSNTPTAFRVGTVGKPIRNVLVRIAADGEIEISGPGVMLGYFRKETATRDTFTSDGWFKTGDIGEIDPDGYLKITDRKKELFKTSGGKYIAPTPIEQMIKTSRFVNQVVLIGNERNFPAALIVPNFEQLESYAKIKGLRIKTAEEYCHHPSIISLLERQVADATATLSNFERVKKIALLEHEFTVESGELTPTLKVKRRAIDEKYRSIIDRIYVDK